MMGKIKGIIFDLDQTLIDSSSALELRRNREWRNVYKLIPNFTDYPYISELMEELKSKNIKVCVVTSSPRSYCEKVLNNFGWSFVGTVCYHDTTRRKPHREPMDKALQLLSLKPNEVVSVGDDINDMISSNSADIVSIGVTWGINNSNVANEADYVFDNTKDFREFILKNI